MASLAQPVPFQRSTSEGTPGAEPTAYTLEGDSAATPNSRPPWGVGLGTGTLLQLRPSQWRAKGTCHSRAVENIEPTAQTSLLASATTPSRVPSLAVGLGTTLQADPSQWRISGAATE